MPTSFSADGGCVVVHRDRTMRLECADDCTGKLLHRDEKILSLRNGCAALLAIFPRATEVWQGFLQVLPPPCSFS
jgi:hypothetical protein